MRDRLRFLLSVCLAFFCASFSFAQNSIKIPPKRLVADYCYWSNPDPSLQCCPNNVLTFW
jgi:hypothetical protein